MDGTASLANREIGSVSAANHQKVPFSGAAEHANEPAGAGYFGDLSGESPETGLVGGAERIRTIGSAYSARKTANFFDFLFSARQTDSGQQGSTVSPWPGIPPCFTAFLSAAGIARAVSMSGLNSNCSLEHNLRDHKTPGVLQRRARLRTCAREHQWARYRQPHRPFHTEVKHAGNTTAAHPKTLDFSARSQFLVGTPSLRRISRRRYLTPAPNRKSPAQTYQQPRFGNRRFVGKYGLSSS